MGVLGIDLGTTYSSLAFLDVTGRPTVIRTRDGIPAIPSIVYLPSATTAVVGDRAKDIAVLEPDSVIDLIKREMGTDTTIPLHGRRFTPEEISAMILRRLIADAGDTAGDHPDVVIAVPTTFGIAEREATRAAGELAGLTVLDVLSEPVAAAINYGVLDMSRDQTILVYDLGGGTFDTTVISVADGYVREVCAGGDAELGGVDWDERLSDHLLTVFSKKYPDSSHPFDNAATLNEIRVQAEKAKIRLTEGKRHTLHLVHEGQVVRAPITREEFEEQTRDLLDRTIEITRSVIATAAKRGAEHIDHVILVGGASQMPAVAERLRTELGKTPMLFEPELAVAKGVARYAFDEKYRRLLAVGNFDAAQELTRPLGYTPEQEAQIAQKTLHRLAGRDVTVVGHNSAEPKTEHHAVRSTDQLPTKTTMTLRTQVENQAELGIRVLEQPEDEPYTQNPHRRVAAKGVVTIPAGKPAGWAVDVTVGLTSGGLLRAYAAENGTRNPLPSTFEASQVNGTDIARLRDTLPQVEAD